MVMSKFSCARDYEEDDDLLFSYNGVELLSPPFQEFSIFLDAEDNIANFIGESSGTTPLQHAVPPPCAGEHQLANDVGEADGSSMKKSDHNAKERVRRLKLSTSYLALRSLLPDHPKKPKKKWSAPCIIDRALECIPELEGVIQKLTSKKEDIMLLLIGNNKEKVLDHRDAMTAAAENQTLTLSVNEVKRGEVIIQICMHIHQEKIDVFSNLIENLEGEGMQLKGASGVFACDDRYCYHLHLQMDENKLAADYIALLKDKVVSWLCT
ncbi:hypothetical protein Ancab_026897 [Ancistrocladus abbreviatus]